MILSPRVAGRMVLLLGTLVVGGAALCWGGKKLTTAGGDEFNPRLWQKAIQIVYSHRSKTERRSKLQNLNASIGWKTVGDEHILRIGGVTRTLEPDSDKIRIVSTKLRTEQGNVFHIIPDESQLIIVHNKIVNGTEMYFKTHNVFK